MTRVDVTVSVDAKDTAEFDALATAAEAAGLEIQGRMPRVGTLTGKIDSARIERLSKVPGVQAVEPDRKYKLAPPDNDTQ